MTDPQPPNPEPVSRIAVPLSALVVGTRVIVNTVLWTTLMFTCKISILPLLAYIIYQRFFNHA